ncbi:unnamed protein product [Ambrosiozyma monospora]|uniref:Unnamed protein product n=1 Tax=Ambrosiozyma monospora TaxID=43982 RepID=A0ACB5ST75_AMBMO|nr:unnamed protein product [Ambrosiozyma monospora]
MGKIMPPQHYVKINIYLEILINIITHHFYPSPKFHINIPVNVTATQLKKVVKKKKKGKSKPEVEEKPLVGEELVVHLIGPYCGKYGLILKDVGSQYIWYSILNRKSQATEENIVWLRKIMNQLNRFKLNVFFLRSDNEFHTIELKQFCNANGIHQEFTSPGHSYQNESALFAAAGGKYDIPTTVEEAMETDEWMKWYDAINDENRSLEEHSVYFLVKIEDVPKGTKIINGRYVFDVKKGPNNKERF